jgi:hypothetical protein
MILFLTCPARQVERGPLAVERPLIEELEATERNVEPTARNLLVVLEIEKV